MTFLKNITPVVCLLLLIGGKANAQELSNKGKEFWVGYGHHQFMEPLGSNSQDMVIYLSAEQAATVTVTVDGTPWTRTYSLAANTVIATEPIPKSGPNDARLFSVPPSYGGTGGEGIFTNKGIHIQSNVAIVAYAHIFGSASSGATMLMPVNTWGYSYISLNSQQNYADDCFSWMYVIAKENNTVIEIKPSEPSRNGRVANVPFTITLNKGEIYQLVGASLGGGRGRELTGTTVKSLGNSDGKCFPVAVFSGSSRTAINCSGSNIVTGDNNMQQVFPFQSWGKRYLTAPISGASTFSYQTNIYKIVVKDPTTVVKVNGNTLSGLTPHSCYEFESRTADYIESDKPILVAQFMASGGGCPFTNGLGDPEMIYLSPIEQATKRVAFYRNTVEYIEVNALLMVIPDGGLTSLLIDGSNTYDVAYPHPNKPGYSVVVKRWKSAVAQCIVSSDSAFNAITYGLGSFESYGYNAGTYLNNLNAIGQIHNEADTSAKQQSDFTCVNTPVNLSVLFTYQPTKLVWQLSKLGTAVTPSADITDNAPVAIKQVTIKGNNYYQYTLPQTYQFAAAGDYDISVLSTAPHIQNCNNTEEIIYTVTVKGKPAAVATYQNASGCANDSVHFAGQSTGNGYQINRWEWDFSKGIIAKEKNTTQLFATGVQPVKLTVISAEGCVADTSFNIDIYPVPHADFTVGNSICQGVPVRITDKSSITAGTISSWEWTFGDSSSATKLTAAPFDKIFTTAGTLPVKLLITSDHSCKKDTSINVTVHAAPFADFSLPKSVCMPEGEAVFTNLTTISDQSVLTYQWNFGDGSSAVTTKSPVHAYAAENDYAVKLEVNTAFGCKDDTTKYLNAFFDKPVADFTVTPETLCQGTDNSFTDKSTAANSVIQSWAWDFGDGSSNGVRNPAKRYAEAGDYTVQLSVTSAAGCISLPVTKTVKVYLQPVVDAGPSFTVEFGSTIQFQPVVNSTSGLDFSWTPAGDLSGANYLRPTLTALRDETYTLTATGLGGCTASDEMKVTVYKPVKIPNAFSPNGDHINDTWMITNLADYRNSTLEVFNRYGQIVYKSTGYDRPWDGTYNGKQLPLATYYYVIKLKDGSAPLTGYVVILK
ncbi:gliding motility-associated C-terminal domain-containing protein [Chitinophaga sp. CF118]|uniref:PKD domain-containing protein n=1 Tax=Chitinophaga sp. CF118 TaxID=1884367 RepID=UPI0008E8F50A|nr:PKD domain-containing protein [Chitinophaga sp. CF118]SFE97107.1 gliding motility-associated C-terminal domain-containing protein [Chitinophaga sp. CF118]